MDKRRISVSSVTTSSKKSSFKNSKEKSSMSSRMSTSSKRKSDRGSRMSEPSSRFSSELSNDLSTSKLLEGMRKYGNKPPPRPKSSSHAVSDSDSDESPLSTSKIQSAMEKLYPVTPTKLRKRFSRSKASSTSSDDAMSQSMCEKAMQKNFPFEGQKNRTEDEGKSDDFSENSVALSQSRIEREMKKYPRRKLDVSSGQNKSSGQNVSSAQNVSKRLSPEASLPLTQRLSISGQQVQLHVSVTEGIAKKKRSLSHQVEDDSNPNFLRTTTYDTSESVDQREDSARQGKFDKSHYTEASTLIGENESQSLVKTPMNPKGRISVGTSTRENSAKGRTPLGNVSASLESHRSFSAPNRSRQSKRERERSTETGGSKVKSPRNDSKRQRSIHPFSSDESMEEEMPQKGVKSTSTPVQKWIFPPSSPSFSPIKQVESGRRYVIPTVKKSSAPPAPLFIKPGKPNPVKARRWSLNETKSPSTPVPVKEANKHFSRVLSLGRTNIKESESRDDSQATPSWKQKEQADDLTSGPKSKSSGKNLTLRISQREQIETSSDEKSSGSKRSSPLSRSNKQKEQEKEEKDQNKEVVVHSVPAQPAVEEEEEEEEIADDEAEDSEEEKEEEEIADDEAEDSEEEKEEEEIADDEAEDSEEEKEEEEEDKVEAVKVGDEEKEGKEKEEEIEDEDEEDEEEKAEKVKEVAKTEGRAAGKRGEEEEDLMIVEPNESDSMKSIGPEVPSPLKATPKSVRLSMSQRVSPKAGPSSVGWSQKPAEFPQDLLNSLVLEKTAKEKKKSEKSAFARLFEGAKNVEKAKKITASKKSVVSGGKRGLRVSAVEPKVSSSRPRLNLGKSPKKRGRKKWKVSEGELMRNENLVDRYQVENLVKIYWGTKLKKTQMEALHTTANLYVEMILDKAAEISDLPNGAFRFSHLTKVCEEEELIRPGTLDLYCTFNYFLNDRERRQAEGILFPPPGELDTWIS